MAAATLCSSPGDCDAHDCWPRDGPVRLLQGTTSVRRNRPAACEECRRRRVRCSGFETGAPCEACIRHETTCTVGGVKYAYDATSRTQVYRPVLPPPPAPSSTPSFLPNPRFQISLVGLNSALETVKPRPPPLVWESPNEHIQKCTPTTRSRQKAVENANDGETGQEREPAPPCPKRRRLREKTPPDLDARDHATTAFHEGPSKPFRGAKSKRLARSEPVRPARHFPASSPAFHSPPHLVVYSSQSTSLVTVSAWKEQTRQVVSVQQPLSSRLPISSARDEPNLRPPYTPLPFAPSYTAPHFHSFADRSPDLRPQAAGTTTLTASTSTSTSTWASEFGFRQHRSGAGESSATSISDPPQSA